MLTKVNLKTTFGYLARLFQVLAMVYSYPCEWSYKLHKLPSLQLRWKICFSSITNWLVQSLKKLLNRRSNNFDYFKQLCKTVPWTWQSTGKVSNEIKVNKDSHRYDRKKKAWHFTTKMSYYLLKYIRYTTRVMFRL